MGLDTVESIVETERIFGIDIPDREAEEINTVGDLQSCVWRHLQAKPPELRPEFANQEWVYRRVVEIVHDRSGMPLEEITPEASLTNDLGMD